MRKRWTVLVSVLMVTGLAFAVTPGLPEVLDDYYSWTRLNINKVIDNPSGVHPPAKDIYVNLDHMTLSLLAREGGGWNPFPDGALVLKERNDPESRMVDRLYLMEKRDGVWHYSLYDRQPDGGFAGQDLGTENMCSGCHAGAADNDFVFNLYQSRP